MMAGNPNWYWSFNNILSSSQASFSPCSSLFDHHLHTSSDSDHASSNSYVDGQEEFSQSWSQLLMDGIANEQEDDSHHPNQLQDKKIGSADWEEYHQETLNPLSKLRFLTFDVNEPSAIPASKTSRDGSMLYINDRLNNSLLHTCNTSSNAIQVNKKSMVVSKRQQIAEHGLSKCNSMVTGTSTGENKKARVQSSSLPPLRVRKELGDKITALHQIVSPFGKTDTASVLLEAIGYIRFLQGQIQALSSPYLDNSRSSNIRHHHPLHDLRSRGLCLVPISCINDHIESGIKGAVDFWVTPTPGLGGGV